jgi:membrane-associated phospholipid phosphatase
MAQSSGSHEFQDGRAHDTTPDNEKAHAVSGAGVNSSISHLVPQTVLKLAAVLLFFAAWIVLYDRTNQHGADPIRTIHLKRPLDQVPGIIQPWTAVIYVFGGLAMPLLPFAFNWTWPRLTFVLLCYTLTSLLAFTCYWLWPLGIIRPVYLGNGIGEQLMRGVFSVDLEANCCPSSHTFYAILGAILVSHGGAGPVTRRLTWALAVAVCVTTVTTGQHYFIDILGGVVAALLGYTAARSLTAAAGYNCQRCAFGASREPDRGV